MFDINKNVLEIDETGEINTGNINLIPSPDYEGKANLTLATFEDYSGQTRIKYVKKIDLHDGGYCVAMIQEVAPNSVMFFMNENLTVTPVNQLIEVITNEPATFVRSLKTPTETVLVFSSGEMRSVKMVNGNYQIINHVIHGYDNIKQINVINQTYVMHSGKNTIALSGAITYGTDIDPLNVITLPIQNTEEIQELTVFKNRLIIFTKTQKIEYNGYTRERFPITYYASATRKFSIKRINCVKQIGNRLFALGSTSSGTTELYELKSSDLVNTAYNSYLNIDNIGGTQFLQTIEYNSIRFLQIVGARRSILMRIKELERSYTFVMVGQVEDEKYNQYVDQYEIAGETFALCRAEQRLKNMNKPNYITPRKSALYLRINNASTYILEAYAKTNLTNYRLEISKRTYKEDFLTSELNTTTTSIKDGLNKVRIKRASKPGYSILCIKFIRFPEELQKSENIDIIEKNTLKLESFTIRRV